MAKSKVYVAGTPVVLGGEEGSDVFEDGEEIVHRFGAEHGDAGGAEVGDAFEERCRSEVATGVEDASFLVDAGDIDTQLFDEDVQFGVEVENHGDRAAVLRELRTVRPVPMILVEVIAYLFEYPRTAEGGATNHDGIDAIGVEGLLGLLG